MTKTYIGVDEEGIVVLAIVDNPEHKKDVAKELGKAVRNGLVIERVESSRVREIFGEKFEAQQESN